MTKTVSVASGLLLAFSGACGGGGENEATRDAGAGRCALDAECPADAPVCDTSSGECAECTSALYCTRFGNAPFCVDGACVGCGEPGETDFCAEQIEPICDATTGNCRGCMTNSECGSGACARGDCVPEVEAIYVAPGSSTTSACTRQDPCGTIARGLELVDPTRRIVVLADGTYGEAIVIGAPIESVQIVGDGAILQRPTAGPVIRVRDGVGFGLERVVLQGATGSNGHGIYCSGTADRTTSLGMNSVVTRDNAADGILAVDCELSVKGAVIEDNVDRGIVVTGTMGSATLHDTWVRRNGGGGVDLDSGLYVIFNLVIADNGNTDDAQVGGILIHQSGIEADGEVRHLTVARNRIPTALDRNPGIDCLDAPTLLTNTIVWENEGDQPQIDSTCGARFTLVSPGPVPGGLETFEGDPSFVDADSGNYDLGPKSEAIDRGDPDDPTPFDIHGDRRGEYGMADLGADEYAP